LMMQRCSTSIGLTFFSFPGFALSFRPAIFSRGDPRFSHNPSIPRNFKWG
jgi:hypothetical protein